MSMVEVRVPNLDCEGCASKLKRALLKLKGMFRAMTASENAQFPRCGRGGSRDGGTKDNSKRVCIGREKVLKAIKRAGKAAELWPFPGHPHFSSFYKYPNCIVNHYYDPYRNCTTNGVHTFFHTPAVYSVAVASDEAIASIFSDDNPHACTIM